MVSPAHKRQRMLRAGKSSKAGPLASAPAELVSQPRIHATNELGAPTTARPVVSGQTEPQRASSITSQSRQTDAPLLIVGTDTHQAHSSSHGTPAAQRLHLDGGAGTSTAAEPVPQGAVATTATPEIRRNSAPAPTGAVVSRRMHARGASAETLYQCHGQFLPADVPALAQLVCCAACNGGFILIGSPSQGCLCRHEHPMADVSKGYQQGLRFSCVEVQHARAV